MSKLLVFGVLLAAGWLLLNVMQVFETMGSITLGNEVIGQGGASGIVGLLVMAVLAGLLLFLYSELGETDPSPEPFPPENRSTTTAETTDRTGTTTTTASGTTTTEDR